MLPYLLDVLGLLAVPLLVGLNGFFVAAEFSLVTVRWTRVEELVSEGKFGALSVREAISQTAISTKMLSPAKPGGLSQPVRNARIAATTHKPRATIAVLNADGLMTACFSAVGMAAALPALPPAAQ